MEDSRQQGSRHGKGFVCKRKTPCLDCLTVVHDAIAFDHVLTLISSNAMGCDPSLMVWVTLSSGSFTMTCISDGALISQAECNSHRSHIEKATDDHSRHCLEMQPRAV